MDVEPLGAEDYPEETGGTYEENARFKARFGRDRAPAGVWVLGEDAGIEVEGLGWGPGVRSARWSGDPLVELVAALGNRPDRRARYRSTIFAISPDGREIVVAGSLEGSIAHRPRGSEGFGYDPIFVPDGEEQTVAELGNRWKSRNSARARAARKLRAALDAS